MQGFRSFVPPILAIATMLAAGGPGLAQRAVIKPPTPGTQSATPIEIPLWPAILDPTKRPDLFKALPLPIPGARITRGKVGRYSFQRNETGLIVGQTRFGYAYFRDMADYTAFLKRFP